MHLHLNYSDRIIRCFGISLDRKTNEYLLIMQYANDGDLQSYLKVNFKNLTWNDKKKLAFQIADGLNCLHNENILHRDLHSKNIVIHENNAKITDFGNIVTSNLVKDLDNLTLESQTSDQLNPDFCIDD
ncbi:unnamed protein product [Rhizophagus irregularis]|uniref:Protein kinase domain-containing protein n=1 Tax=Rhizophagus irregularis TaxID=588596 RepID=A0A915YUD1_9GLOM|nr:unnamed protein product [Rhizophagus irregularis]